MFFVLLDAPCDRQCDTCHPDPSPVNILHTIINCIGIFATMIFPLYKTYKALESGKLRPARAMLAFWAVSTLITGLKGVVDETVGAYSAYIVYKLALLAVKLIPVVLGPDMIYANFLRPVFAKEEGDVDNLLRKAYAVKEVAEEEILEPLKQRIKEALPYKSIKTDNQGFQHSDKDGSDDFHQHLHHTNQYWKDLNQLNNDSSMRRRRIPLQDEDEFDASIKNKNEIHLAEEVARKEAEEHAKVEREKQRLHAELLEKMPHGQNNVLHAVQG